MTLAERQNQIIEDLLIIPDAQERLAAVVARAKNGSNLTHAERNDANRVPGCVSPVWLVGEKDTVTQRLRIRTDADSPLVKGLVALVCELYDGSALADAATFQPDLLEKLHFTQNLSPTRRNGLTAVQARIRALATAHLQ